MTATPTLPQTYKSWIGQLTAANTNRDGTGTIVTIATAGTNGSVITSIYLMGVGTVTGGMIRLYIHDGTNYRLWKEVAVTATTPSGTVAGWSSTIDCSYPGNPLYLPTGYSLRASTNNAETFNVIAEGGDY